MSKKYSQLYAKASTGKTKIWIIEARGDEMIIKSGCIGDKIKELPPKKIIGKNIGRANETTPEQQCELECQAKWQKKVDEQYVEDIGAVTDYTEKEILLPMLAHSYQKRKHDIKFPCYVQPKLNGVRCIFQNGKFISRGGKEFDTLEHLRPELKKLGVAVPDGEIYIHGMNFQQIIRLVKKDRKDGSNEKLEYWIYDQICANNYKDRLQELIDKFPEENMLHVKGVKTVEVTCEEDIKLWHNIFVKGGFEGVIIRNAEGGYDVKHRSKNLQKYKEFFDEEFKITGFTEGSGPEAGCIVFKCYCKGARDDTLDVRPRGSFELRREWFKKGKSFIGKDLTVRFQERSEAGVPIFPVGIAVRDYE